MSGPFRSGQILTADQLNAAVPTTIATGTSTDAGSMDGTEVLPVSRSGGLLQTTLTKIAQWVIQTYQGFTQSGAGAVARTVQDELRDRVSVKQFGAKGDGVTDDSSKITSADAYCASVGRTLWFPAGVYCANNLSMTAAWSMSLSAKILYNGATQGQCLQCTANGLACGDIFIDCNSLEPYTGFLISGNYNHFRSIRIENLISTNQAWVVRSIYLNGTFNTVDKIFLRNLVNQGNTNDSSPQGLTLSSPATGNVFPLVIGDNTRSVVVDSSTGANRVGELHATECQDNGFYGVAACNTAIGAIFFDAASSGSAASAAGFRHGANATIGQIHILSTNTDAIFFGDCGDITIGDIFVHGNTHTVLYMNQAAAGKIKVGSIRGLLNDTAAFAMMTSNGTVQYLSIGEVDLKINLSANFTGDTRNVALFTGVNGYNFGRFKLDVVLNGFTPTNPLYIQFNTAVTYSSFVGAIRFSAWQSDEITPYTAQSVFTTGLAGQSNVQLGEGVLNSSNYIRPYNYSVYGPNRLIAAAAPTAGTWSRGTVIWIDVTTASQRGWVCTASGTPGTWSPF